MKKILFVITVVLFVFTKEGFAQRKNKKDPTPKFTEKLWFGGGFDLGLGSNQFNLGLSPMVGYKISSKFSAGIRLPLEYTYVKLFNARGDGLNYNNVNWGLGTFSRYKIFDRIFAHAEYNYLFIKEPATSGNNFVIDPENPNKLLKESSTRDEFNLGLGYSSGGKIGYDISLLYNVLNETNSNNIPWSIRAGVNYKF